MFYNKLLQNFDQLSNGTNPKKKTKLSYTKARVVAKCIMLKGYNTATLSYAGGFKFCTVYVSNYALILNNCLIVWGKEKWNNILEDNLCAN